MWRAPAAVESKRHLLDSSPRGETPSASPSSHPAWEATPTAPVTRSPRCATIAGVRQICLWQACCCKSHANHGPAHSGKLALLRKFNIRLHPPVGNLGHFHQEAQDPRRRWVSARPAVAVIATRPKWQLLSNTAGWHYAPHGPCLLCCTVLRRNLPASLQLGKSGRSPLEAYCATLWMRSQARVRNARTCACCGINTTTVTPSFGTPVLVPLPFWTQLRTALITSRSKAWAPEQWIENMIFPMENGWFDTTMSPLLAGEGAFPTCTVCLPMPRPFPVLLRTTLQHTFPTHQSCFARLYLVGRLIVGCAQKKRVTRIFVFSFWGEGACARVLRADMCFCLCAFVRHTPCSRTGKGDCRAQCHPAFIGTHMTLCPSGSGVVLPSRGEQRNPIIQTLLPISWVLTNRAFCDELLADVVNHFAM